MKFVCLLLLSLAFVSGCIATSPQEVNEGHFKPLVAELEIPLQVTIYQATKIYTHPTELSGKILMTSRISMDATVTHETTSYFEDQFGPNHWVYIVFSDGKAGWIPKSILVDQ